MKVPTVFLFVALSLGLLIYQVGCGSQQIPATTTVTATTTSTTTTLSPANFQIAFTVYSGNRYGDLFTMNLNGSGRNQITSGSKSSAPAYAPDKSKIVFVYSAALDQIYSIKANGDDLTNLSQNNNSENGPALLPNGTKIYFSSNLSGGYQIRRFNLDGSVPASVTNLGSNTWGVKFIPNGTKIIFNSNAFTGLSTLEDVYVASSDGTSILRLTTTEGRYDNVLGAISPDGLKFAYTSWLNSSSSEVFIRNLAGSGEVNLSNGSFSYINSQPGFSADSSKVVFQSNRSGTYEVYKVNIDGTGLTTLTATSKNYKPQFLPNNQILFISERDGFPQIYKMNADGTSQTKISNGSANDGDGLPESTEKPVF